MSSATIARTDTTDQQLSLTRDAAAGACLVHPTTTTLRVPDPKPRKLNIIRAQHLTELDLAGCALGVRLTILDCPFLEPIRFPEQGSGAVLHLDSGNAPLRVEPLGLGRGTQHQKPPQLGEHGYCDCEERQRRGRKQA